MPKTIRSFHTSADRIAARARLRRIATEAAQQTSWNPDRVLQRLVADQFKAIYADDLPMLPGAIEFETGLHHRDVQRAQLQAATAEVLDLLAF